VPLVVTLCGDDANIGRVQRNLNNVAHSDSHRAPGLRSSHKGAPSPYYILAHHGSSGRASFGRHAYFGMNHRSNANRADQANWGFHAGWVLN
jgi:hypothetical protein